LSSSGHFARGTSASRKAYRSAAEQGAIGASAGEPDPALRDWLRTSRQVAKPQPPQVRKHKRGRAEAAAAPGGSDLAGAHSHSRAKVRDESCAALKRRDRRPAARSEVARVQSGSNSAAQSEAARKAD